jgi:hypothetical protein
MSESPVIVEKKRAFDTYVVDVEVADLVTPHNKHLKLCKEHFFQRPVAR